VLRLGFAGVGGVDGGVFPAEGGHGGGTSGAVQCRSRSVSVRVESASCAGRQRERATGARQSRHDADRHRTIRQLRPDTSRLHLQGIAIYRVAQNVITSRTMLYI